MNNEERNIYEVKPLDEEKLNRIIRKIIELENENVKTKDYNDAEIKKKIEKIIEEEVKCY